MLFLILIENSIKLTRNGHFRMIKLVFILIELFWIFMFINWRNWLRNTLLSFWTPIPIFYWLKILFLDLSLILVFIIIKFIVPLSIWLVLKILYILFSIRIFYLLLRLLYFYIRIFRSDFLFILFFFIR